MDDKEIIRIYIGSGADDLEKYAAQELAKFIDALSPNSAAFIEKSPEEGLKEGNYILLGSPQKDDFLLNLWQQVVNFPCTELDEEEIIIYPWKRGTAHNVIVSGGSSRAVLYAVYEFLEQLGILFEFSGTYAPRTNEITLCGIKSVREKPDIPERGWRLHCNFPVDQTAFSLTEFKDWVDCAARLRTNTIMFHCYANEPPTYSFSFRDVRVQYLDYFEDCVSDRLPLEMPGRDKIRDKRRFSYWDCEGLDGRETRKRLEDFYRQIMNYTHKRGMRNVFSFEPLAPEREIIENLSRWANHPVSPTDIDESINIEVAIARIQAILQSYPLIDELHLVTQEGSSDMPADISKKKELLRLLEKYHVPQELVDWEKMGKHSLRPSLILAPSWDPNNLPDAADRGSYRPVVSTLRFVDFVLRLLNQDTVRDTLSARGIEPSIGIYLPFADAVEILEPLLVHMIPTGFRVQLMPSHAPRDLAEQLPRWRYFPKADWKFGIMSWVQFDGTMLLPQCWIEANNQIGHHLSSYQNLTTAIANHWSIHGVEASAGCFARSMWNVQLPLVEFYREYLGKLYGTGNIELARKVYEAIEAFTEYSRTNLWNIGFTAVTLTYQYGPYRKSCYRQTRKMASTAILLLEELWQKTENEYAKTRSRYLLNRMETALKYLDFKEEHDAGLIGLPCCDDHTWPDDEIVCRAIKHMRRSIELIGEHMRTYAEMLLGRDDEGTLANCQYFMEMIGIQIHRMQQHLETPAAKREKSGYVPWDSKWKLFGPFESGEISDVATPLERFKEIPDEIEYAEEKIAAAEYRSIAGLIDFGAVYDFTSKMPFGYGMTVIEVPRDQTMDIRYNVDWGLRVLLNGEVILESSGCTGEVPLPLKKGENVICFRVQSGSIGWNIRLQKAHDTKLAKL